MSPGDRSPAPTTVVAQYGGLCRALGQVVVWFCAPLIVATRAIVWNAVAANLLRTGRSGFFLPGFAQALALGKNEGFGVVEGFVDASALDHVAWAAAGYEVGGIFFALASPRHNEIHGHDQSVFKG